MTGFQTNINQQPAPAVEGDFAGMNPKSSALPCVEGAFKVAPGQSVRVGFFAWAAANGLVYSSSAAAAAITGGIVGVGFVGRQANVPGVAITTYLAESRMTLNDGQPVTLLTGGDFWAAFAAGAAANVAVYATAADGSPTTTAGGNTATRYKTVQAVPANGVSDATATIAANTGVLTLSAPASGAYAIGARVTGTGVPANTYIKSQISGTPNGVGTYQTNSKFRAAVAAFTATIVQGALGKISSNT